MEKRGQSTSSVFSDINADVSEAWACFTSGESEDKKYEYFALKSQCYFINRNITKSF